jgi:Uma2 family endonuclease
MAAPAYTEPRYTCEDYFGLVAAGLVRPDDRIELLEGVIVAMSPQNPLHAAITAQVSDALHHAIGMRAAIRVQSPLVTSRCSAPEPDIAVVSGRHADYVSAHPSTAFLVVEVADSSLVQDRLTKAGIYAAAGIPEYWIVNVRDDRVEVLRAPDQAAGHYAASSIAARGGRIDVLSLPGVSVAVDDLLPMR